MLYQAVRQREPPGQRREVKRSGPSQGLREVQAPHPRASARLQKEPGRSLLAWSLGFSFLTTTWTSSPWSLRGLCVNDLRGELSLNPGPSVLQAGKLRLGGAVVCPGFPCFVCVHSSCAAGGKPAQGGVGRMGLTRREASGHSGPACVAFFMHRSLS